MFQVLKKASDIPEYSFLPAYNSFLIKTLNPLHLNQGYNFLVTGMITCLLVYMPSIAATLTSNHTVIIR